MTTFNAHLEFARDVDEHEADSLFSTLMPFNPSVGRSPAGRLSIRLWSSADHLEQMVQLAIALCRNAGVRDELTLLEVMTETEFDAREGFDHVPELVTTAIAGEILGVSQQRVSQMVDEGKFVSAQRAGKRTTVIARSEVERLAARAAAATE